MTEFIGLLLGALTLAVALSFSIFYLSLKKYFEVLLEKVCRLEPRVQICPMVSRTLLIYPRPF